MIDCRNFVEFFREYKDRSHALEESGSIGRELTIIFWKAIVRVQRDHIMFFYVIHFCINITVKLITCYNRSFQNTAMHVWSNAISILFIIEDLYFSANSIEVKIRQLMDTLLYNYRFILYKLYRLSSRRSRVEIGSHLSFLQFMCEI